ncbi:hypothetical protein F4776DRAFT_665295 [Hypoxylon sp. NC0597]|nr:hypothetical protein F4776DRAFT_665295 [Hypoxylon sp. NC0597]
MAPTRNDGITLSNGTKLTLKEVEIMFAALRHSSRELKESVNWEAVSRDVGHGSAKSARDRMSHLGQKFRWFQTTIVPKGRVTKK